MSQTLSEALHEKLDALGAPPRAEQTPVEIPDDEPTESEEEITEDLEAGQDIDDESGEVLVEDSEEDVQTDADEGEAVAEEAGDRYKPAELAEAIGWDAPTLYNSLTVPLANGKSLTLGEMKDQFDGVLTQQAEVETARQQLANQYQELQQQQQQMVQGFQGVSQEIQEAQGQMRAIEAQYEQVDWDRMDKDDPGKAANVRQKFATAYSRAEAQLQKAQTEAEQAQYQVANEMRGREAQRLTSLVPDWKDMKKYEEEAPQIQQYLMSRGFNEQELATIFHAGAWAVARDAWLGQQGRQAVEQAKGKIRKAPRKIMRPGGPPRRQVAEKRVNALSARARQTGQPGDKLAAARAIVQQSLNRRK